MGYLSTLREVASCQALIPLLMDRLERALGRAFCLMIRPCTSLVHAYMPPSAAQTHSPFPPYTPARCPRTTRPAPPVHLAVTLPIIP
jgi:hypothetical protein